MKNILSLIIAIFLLTINSESASAQAWERHSKVMALGFGASQFFHIDNYYYTQGNNVRQWYWPLTGQINLQGEFGVHEYVGLGFTTGVGGRAGLGYGYAGEINIPMGMIVNFHFYQLIANKSSKNIHADKLDIYAGLNAGSGLAITYYSNSTRLVPLAFGGPHVGLRYYPIRKFGLNVELGFGKSIINGGFVFKL